MQLEEKFRCCFEGNVRVNFGGECPGGSCLRRKLSRGVVVQRVNVQGGSCPDTVTR